MEKRIVIGNNKNLNSGFITQGDSINIGESKVILQRIKYISDDDKTSYFSKEMRDDNVHENKE